jgi:uncharacterized protein (DUF927 family)
MGPEPNKTPISLENGISITRSLSDQHGGSHIQVSKNGKSDWGDVSELIASEANVFQKLSKSGITIVTQKSKSALKDAVEKISVYVPGLVATQPGWLMNQAYVFPDGTAELGKHVDEVLVSFERNPNYTAKGRLKNWRKDAAVLLEGQPTLQFQMVLIFAGMLLSVFKPAKDTIISELVGAKEAGKTTAAVWLGTVYGGDQYNSRGIVRSANATKQAFAGLQRSTCDSALILDETNLMDKAVITDEQLLFDLTDPNERARFNGTAASHPYRNCILLTGNNSILKYSNFSQEIANAAQSRLLSFDVGNSIFDTLPHGYATKDKALAAMRYAATQNYGVASRKFMRELVRQVSDEKRAPELMSRIQKDIAKFRKNAIKRNSGEYSNRHLEACAVAYAAGKLAIGWKILPIELEELRHSCIEAFLKQSVTLNPNLERIIAVIQQNKQRIAVFPNSNLNPIDLSADVLAYSVQAKSGATVYWFDQELLKSKLGNDHRQVLQALREQDHLKGETGKLASKPPKSFGVSNASHRMYKISFAVDPLHP